jgi:hypothetical protein
MKISCRTQWIERHKKQEMRVRTCSSTVGWRFPTYSLSLRSCRSWWEEEAVEGARAGRGVGYERCEVMLKLSCVSGHLVIGCEGS